VPKLSPAEPLSRFGSAGTWALVAGCRGGRRCPRRRRRAILGTRCQEIARPAKDGLPAQRVIFAVGERRESSIESLAQPKGFQAVSHDLTFAGICAACNAGNAGNAGNSAQTVRGVRDRP